MSMPRMSIALTVRYALPYLRSGGVVLLVPCCRVAPQFGHHSNNCEFALQIRRGIDVTSACHGCITQHSICLHLPDPTVCRVI